MYNRKRIKIAHNNDECLSHNVIDINECILKDIINRCKEKVSSPSYVHLKIDKIIFGIFTKDCLADGT